MENKFTPAKWKDEFAAFVEGCEENPPAPVASALLSRVLSDLRPSNFRVALKLALVLLFSAPANLFICPQFNLSFTHPSTFLREYFMAFGHTGCMAACGALFVGSTMLLAAMLLRPEEVRAVRASMLLQVMFVSLFSVGGFVCLGADMFLSAALVWLIAALVAGILSVELGWKLRLLARTFLFDRPGPIV